MLCDCAMYWCLCHHGVPQLFLEEGGSAFREYDNEAQGVMGLYECVVQFQPSYPYQEALQAPSDFLDKRYVLACVVLHEQVMSCSCFTAAQHGATAF